VFEYLETYAFESENVAITKRSECVGGFGGCAEVDRCACAFPQFQMSGNEIGVEMR